MVLISLNYLTVVYLAKVAVQAFAAEQTLDSFRTQFSE